MSRTFKPIVATFVWFGAFCAGAAVAADRTGPCTPDHASYVDVDPVTGRETFAYIIAERTMHTQKGDPVKIFAVKRCQQKKNPETGATLWLLEKNSHAVSEAEISSVLAPDPTLSQP